MVGVGAWRYDCSLQCCIRIGVCLPWCWSFFPAQGPWAPPVPQACLQADPSLAEGVEGEISSHPNSIPQAALVFMCAPVTTRAQPHETLKMWHLWVPHKKHGNEAPNSHPPERIDTFSQKYLACRCLAVWWIALMFYRKQILFLWKK